MDLTKLSDDDSMVLVSLQYPMSNLNYFVRSYIQSESANIDTDNDVCVPVFKPISTTQFQIAFREISNNTQSLKVHLEVVQL